MKKIITAVLLFATLISGTVSCTRSSSTPSVNSAPQKPLMAIVNSIKTNMGGTDMNSWDPNTHSYSFTPLVNGTIDQLGYMYYNPGYTDPITNLLVPAPAQEDFVLSLWDANAGSAPLATTGQQTITNAANIVYFPITPVTVVAGQTYYVSREFVPTAIAPDSYGGNVVVSNTAGGIFPQSLLGVITINHSYFTVNADPRLATANPQYDYYLPYIDFQIQ